MQQSRGQSYGLCYAGHKNSNCPSDLKMYESVKPQSICKRGWWEGNQTEAKYTEHLILAHFLTCYKNLKCHNLSFNNKHLLGWKWASFLGKPQAISIFYISSKLKSIHIKNILNSIQKKARPFGRNWINNNIWIVKYRREISSTLASLWAQAFILYSFCMKL